MQSQPTETLSVSPSPSSTSDLGERCWFEGSVQTKRGGSVLSAWGDRWLALTVRPHAVTLHIFALTRCQPLYNQLLHMQTNGRLALYASKEKDPALFHHSFSLSKATISPHSRFKTQACEAAVAVISIAICLLIWCPCSEYRSSCGSLATIKRHLLFT
jgi:hypothetical protein